MLLGLALGLGWWPASDPVAAAASSNLADPVSSCQYRPPFLTRMNLADGAHLSTSTPGIVGLNVLVYSQELGRWRSLLHKTWGSAGNLGQFTTDAAGNLFVVPVPLVSLELNPPQDQNKLYIVDGRTGRLREYLDLPAPKPVTTGNPFGTVGLAYDCQTNSLYVSSLAGSSPLEELGAVFRIDLGRGEVVSRLDGIDALGVGIFNARDGKRLYLGSARRSEILSVALDDSGDFSGEPRLEFKLGELGLPRTYRAQKLRFSANRTMRLKAVPFAYSLRLIGREEVLRMALEYDQADDRWVTDRDTAEPGSPSA